MKRKKRRGYHFDFEKEWTIHDEREFEKIKLDTFAMEFENRLNGSLQKIIDKLMETRETFSKKVEQHKQEELAIDRKKMSRRSYENALADNQFDQMEAETDLQWNEEELAAFHELRIMYAMKNLEINIKRLLRHAFPYASVKTMFKWEALADFLKAQGIDMKTVVAYKEVDQLRQVNNYIKHATRPDKSIQHIAEFKSMENPSAESLDTFYRRVQAAPEVFLQSLLDVVFAHLYKFDDKRIDEMVAALALRMDPKTARRFIQQFSAHYVATPKQNNKR